MASAVQQIERVLDYICAHRRPPSPPPGPGPGPGPAPTPPSQSGIDQRYASMASTVAADCGGRPARGLCSETTPPDPRFFCSNDPIDVTRHCPVAGAHAVCSFPETRTTGCYSASAYVGRGTM